VVEAAEVHDVIYRDEQVDLGILPDIRYTEHETHPYLSAACVVAFDQESGTSNLSFHRLMKHNSRELGIYMTPEAHLDRIFQANRLRGETTPVAVFIGAHPLWSLGSLAAGKLDLDEYAVIGGVIGEPLDVVRGLNHHNLLIPAKAEIALEGEILIENEVPEGPYGDKQDGTYDNDEYCHSCASTEKPSCATRIYRAHSFACAYGSLLSHKAGYRAAQNPRHATDRFGRTTVRQTCSGI